MDKFCQFLTELSARDTSIFSFPEDNLSRCQWIFTKLGMCIDIVEAWFGVANGQISSIFDNYLPPTHPYFFFFFFRDNNLSKSQQSFAKLDTRIDIVEIWFGVATGYILLIFDSHLPMKR